MIKPATTAILALLCLLLIKLNIDTFQSPLAVRQEIDGVEKKESAKKIKIQEPLKLNPVVRSPLPDLGNGYLFNAERFLAKGPRPGKTAKGYGNNIRIEDVVFSGAILGEGYKKAIVTYQVQAKAATHIKRAGPKTSTTDQAKTIQLEVGDELGGYSVKEITADFILFSKGADTVKKTLFDANKNRKQVAPRTKTPAVSTKRAPVVTPPRRPVPPRTVTKP